MDQANIKSFVDTLPQVCLTLLDFCTLKLQGLDTIIGERGAQLSGN